MVKAMAALREAGAVPKWGMKETELQRRNVFLRQLNEVGAWLRGGCIEGLVCRTERHGA